MTVVTLDWDEMIGTTFKVELWELGKFGLLGLVLAFALGLALGLAFALGKFAFAFACAFTFTFAAAFLGLGDLISWCADKGRTVSHCHCHQVNKIAKQRKLN